MDSKYIQRLSFLLLVSTVCFAQDVCPPKDNPQILMASPINRQFLYTPGYYSYGRYATNLDCHWIIRASNSMNRVDVYIYFSQLEDRLFTDCDDFMELRDGSLYNSALIVQWCGTFNPLTVTSSSDSIYVHFKSDLYSGNYAGVNMSYIEHSRIRCPNNWLMSPDQVMCYRLVSPIFGSTWIQAQSHCSYERSNLLTISNRQEYQTVVNLFSTKNEFPWIGVYDAKQEETFVNIDRTERTWPPMCTSISNDGLCFPLFPKHDSKDCVFLHSGQNGNILYGVDDCRNRRTFVCKKRRDGTTVPYPPTESEINEGLIETAGHWSPMYLWLLIVAIIIILLIILAACIVKRVKKKKQDKLNAINIESNRVLLVTSEKPQSTNGGDSGGGLILAYDNVANGKENYTKTVGNGVQNDLKVKPAIKNNNKNPSRNQLHSSPITYYVNGEVHPSKNSEIISSKKTAPIVMPPVEKFGRPNVHVLDNVSAISLDEFWQKIDKSKIVQINVSESPPNEDEGSQIL